MVNAFAEVLQEALRDQVKSGRMSYEQMAARLHRSTAWLYAVAEGERHFHADKIADLCDIINDDTIIAWLAAQRGLACFTIPTNVDVEHASLVETLARSAAYIGAAANAMEDGRVTQDEYNTISAHFDALLSAALSLRAMMKAMVSQSDATPPGRPICPDQGCATASHQQTRPGRAATLAAAESMKQAG